MHHKIRQYLVHPFKNPLTLSNMTHLGSNPFPGRTCLSAFKISSPLEFSWWPNWLVGNAKMTKSEPNFSQSSFICVKSRIVVPHKEAVFSTRTTLPSRSENLNWNENFNKNLNSKRIWKSYLGSIQFLGGKFVKGRHGPHSQIRKLRRDDNKLWCWWLVKSRLASQEHETCAPPQQLWSKHRSVAATTVSGITDKPEGNSGAVWVTHCLYSERKTPYWFNKIKCLLSWEKLPIAWSILGLMRNFYSFSKR